MRILDRYVIRNFVEPFLLCFFGFLSIWLVFDLYDNGPDFLEYHVPLKLIGRFYLSQLPAIALLSLPIGLLLALLFSLSKMSRHNEIISMLTAGRSLWRTIVPLVLIGCAATVGAFALDNEWAPHADAAKKRMLDEMTKGERRAADRQAVEGLLFRDRMNNRTWYVQKMRPKPKQGAIPPLEGVHVIQQDENGVIERKWYGQKAIYDEQTHNWTLSDGQIVTFNKEGDITRTESFPGKQMVIEGWSETPRRIASSQFEAQNLSIGELRDYLFYNGDFPAVQLAPYRTYLADRFANPWTCLVVVFLAAPLGIVYSRRGVLAGVAGCLTLFFNLFMLHYLFLAFGKGGRVNPTLAAWIPNATFFVIGLVLLYMRSSNREIPKFTFWK
ncbi:MAG TPA: LptF/LptG family permease [Chthoniobacteraceae bacterium]|jgi:LPS export ABC transporter permease LptG|nr:LptF/LptG family permease [Chthoniobacteraceae bacterium]